ncbi:hypothetical protein CAJAP_07009 [Camponotus japonicus]
MEPWFPKSRGTWKPSMPGCRTGCLQFGLLRNDPSEIYVEHRTLRAWKGNRGVVNHRRHSDSVLATYKNDSSARSTCYE